MTIGNEHGEGDEPDAEDMLVRGAKDFISHLEELRVTLLRCAGLFFVGCLVVGVFYPYFADILSWPLRRALHGDPVEQGVLVTTSPMAVFSVLLQVCLMGGLGISLPAMLYLLAAFIAPGLTDKEKRVLAPACLAMLVLFLAGASLSYFFVLPVSLDVSLYFNEVFGFALVWNAPSYYGLVVWMTVGVGFCFEFPLILVLLQYLGVIGAETLARYRRHAVVVVMIIAALISPTGDPFTLFILSLPLYLLYEAAILVGRRIEARKARQDAEFWAE